MRTTLTVDNDLLEKVRKTAARQNKPVKAIINEALRLGLNQMQKAMPSKYTLQPKKLGRKAAFVGSSVSEILEQAESEKFK